MDAAAKALATYLRTLLLGNSLYDRAVQKADQRGAKQPAAEDYQTILEMDPDALVRFGKKDQPPAKVARTLLMGQRLFHAEARCAHCHKSWNFTDNEFHNIGIRESEDPPVPGQESGRFRAMPVGLKDERMIGAFRTPSLRNRLRKAPYFHDGQADTLADVIQYYNLRLSAQFNEHLDPDFVTGPRQARQLGLDFEDMAALLLFLRALEGEPAAAARQP
jgi:cytochrome c peroxidase